MTLDENGPYAGINVIQQAFVAITSDKYSEYRIGILGEATLLFLCVVIVSYEYIWFLTIMRWTPRFSDTLIPLALGVTEIIPIFLLLRRALVTGQ